LAESVQVNLGDPVRLIAGRRDGVAVSTRGGCEYQAGAVVVTLPLGVLKSKAVVFDPPLSDARSEAIEKLGMGNVLKVAIRAREPFWGNLEYAMCDGPVSSWWPGPRSASGAAVLIGWAGGEPANRLSGMSRRSIVQAIRRSLGIVFPRHPKVGEADIKFVIWGSDDFAGGAYSCVPPGAEERLKLLAEPENDRIHFAGEAVHPRFPTTVPGAVLSGLEAAKALMRGPRR
jgi:monoamine oxidase